MMENARSGTTQTPISGKFTDMTKSVCCMVTAITVLAEEVSMPRIQFGGETLHVGNEQRAALPPLTIKLLNFE